MGVFEGALDRYLFPKFLSSENLLNERREIAWFASLHAMPLSISDVNTSTVRYSSTICLKKVQFSLIGFPSSFYLDLRPVNRKASLASRAEEWKACGTIAAVLKLFFANHHPRDCVMSRELQSLDRAWLEDDKYHQADS